MDPVQFDIFAVHERKQRAVEAPPFQHAVETSRAAAVAIRPVAGTLRARVLDAIAASAAGLTDEEGCRLTGMNPSTWRPRRGELEVAGLIRAAGVRKSTSGRDMTVWLIHLDAGGGR
jgi:hypothetical protein